MATKEDTDTVDRRPKRNHRGRNNPLTQAKRVSRWVASGGLAQALKVHESRTGTHGFAFFSSYLITACQYIWILQNIRQSLFTAEKMDSTYET